MVGNQSKFLEEETRNGYFVTSDTKKLWSKQLKILEAIKEICAKHNIQYFAVCGTLIGAVRENGFIPWDDDIDIGMTRNDAQKFIQIAQHELPSNLCLVGTTLTSNVFRPHLQIRDKSTTCLTKADFKLKCCKGIWVDIFIFDKFPFDEDENFQFRKKLTRINKMLSYYTFYRCSNNFIKRAIKWCISRVFVFINGGFKRTNRMYDKLCQKYDSLQNSFYYDYLSYKPYRVLKIPYNTFNKTVDHCFENTTIKIPEDFRNALLPEYGDDYLIRKKAPNGHGNVYIDLENSYVKYEKLSRKEFYSLFNK